MSCIAFYRTPLYLGCLLMHITIFIFTIFITESCSSTKLNNITKTEQKNITINLTISQLIKKYIDMERDLFHSSRRQVYSDFDELESDELPIPPSLLRGIQLAMNTSKQKETVHEPYWPGGDWVFRNSTITTPVPVIKKKTRNRVTPQIATCGDKCLITFQNFGKICGMQLDQSTWLYQYHTFNNYCDLQEENCKNTNIWWVVAHKGECTETHPWVLNPDSPIDVIERKKRLLSNLNS